MGDLEISFMGQPLDEQVDQAEGYIQVPGELPLARRAELADNHPNKHENAETICAQPIDQKNESKKTATSCATCSIRFFSILIIGSLFLPP